MNENLPAYTNEDKQLVTKLEDAYVAACYKDTFQISDEAFSCLSERVGRLVDAAIAICDQRFPVLPIALEKPVSIDNSKPYSATFFRLTNILSYSFSISLFSIALFSNFSFLKSIPMKKPIVQILNYQLMPSSLPCCWKTRI